MENEGTRPVGDFRNDLQQPIKHQHCSFFANRISWSEIEHEKSVNVRVRFTKRRAQIHRGGMQIEVCSGSRCERHSFIFTNTIKDETSGTAKRTRSSSRAPVSDAFMRAGSLRSALVARPDQNASPLMRGCSCSPFLPTSRMISRVYVSRGCRPLHTPDVDNTISQKKRYLPYVGVRVCLSTRKHTQVLLPTDFLFPGRPGTRHCISAWS